MKLYLKNLPPKLCHHIQFPLLLFPYEPDQTVLFHLSQSSIHGSGTDGYRPASHLLYPLPDIISVHLILQAE